MSRDQISFAFGGLLFGFLIGFVVSHQIYANRATGFVHPPVPPEAAAGGGISGGERAPIGSVQRGVPAAEGGDVGTMEQIQKEIAAIKDLVKENPGNAQALTRLGDIYFDVGMFDQARPYYEQALAQLRQEAERSLSGKNRGGGAS